MVIRSPGSWCEQPELSGDLIFLHLYPIKSVRTIDPNDSGETHENFRQHLADAEVTSSQMVLAAADRDAVMAFVRSAKDPVSRQQIEAACPIHWDVKYGVFLNQLVRGNWLNETGAGKERRYTVSSAKRVSDDVFLKTEKIG